MPDTQSLVENGVRRYGRFATRPATVNPLEEFGGVRRALRRTRLKEWAGFTLIHPELYSSLIIQDAKYLASSEIYVHDRGTGVRYEHDSAAPPGVVALPADLQEATTLFRRRGYEIRYTFSCERARHVIGIDIAGTDRAPAFRGELHLLPSRASSPLLVSSRLPGGRMYTNKVLFPVEGPLLVGDREFVFDAARDVAILDEHRSFLPYRTSWTWGTFATREAGALIGANFVDRAELPGEQEESCIWTPTAAEPLTGITFDEGTSRVSSADGRLDVTFTPEGRKTVRRQLGIFAIDYYQAYGTYRGTLRAGATTVDLADVHGVWERMRARM